MAAIKRIAAAYGVSPYHIEQISNRLYKVSDGQHAYALKQSKLTETNLLAWEQVYHQAYASNLSNILPVYLTNQSDLYVKQDDSYYYLTPWISDEKPDDERVIKAAYEAMGDVHAKTKQSLSIDTAPIIQEFNDYQQYCAEYHHTLLTYVAMFEQNRFMSPFELQVCTHYHVLTNVLDELNNHLERLKDQLEHEPKWNYSLLHGDLDSSHFLYRNRTYLINWEKATYDNAVLDLAMLLQKEAQFNNQQTAQWAELFQSYQDKNPLTISEQHLLTIYLLDPSHYIALIDAYMANSGPLTMVEHVQLLQRAFRQLEFGLRWSHHHEYDDSSANFENEAES